jgi:hypothetical protein
MACTTTGRRLSVGARLEALDLELKVCQILQMQYGGSETPSPLGA